MRPPKEPHQRETPSVRTIRRTCEKELYRTIKKLKKWIPPDKVEQAEKLYFKKVAENFLWIHENAGKRKVLADWWEENVCPEIAGLWEVDAAALAKAFRSAFGG
ncbi:hypothetical protein [Paenibacillus senegalensis]|uniref:hypothetical protein n=1 Tax=Paenibacillus senegalensis TaxID=1465766 RepID=UPI00028932E7|nr:hypothetical protein [Paenibacillus senegalensis]